MQQHPHQTNLDNQLSSWLQQLDEYQAVLNRWKIRLDAIDGSRRMHVLQHIESAESKIERVREQLTRAQAHGSGGDAGHDVDSRTNRHDHENAGPKDVLKQGFTQAWNELSEAFSKAAKLIAKP